MLRAARRRCSSSIRPATCCGSWGGPGEGYEWPDSNHGIFIDYKGNVWIGGNGGPDSHILKFTKDGKFLMQVGKKGARRKAGAAAGEGEGAVADFVGGSNDQVSFGRVAKIFVDREGERGLRRRRLPEQARRRARRRHRQDEALLGRLRQQARRHAAPGLRSAAPPAQQFRNPVHCADMSVDRLLYVCDRVDNRLQVFTPDGKFVKEAVLREEHAERRLGVGRRVLERRAAALHLHGRRREREGQDHRSRRRWKS